MAGAVLFMLITLAVSGWYWVLPAMRLLKRITCNGGHLMMSELHNDGSRAITDVLLEVEFQTVDGELIDRMSLDLGKLEGHSSISGDDLEMMVIGYTVWDEYKVVIDLISRLHRNFVSRVPSLTRWASGRRRFSWTRQNVMFGRLIEPCLDNKTEPIKDRSLRFIHGWSSNRLSAGVFVVLLLFQPPAVCCFRQGADEVSTFNSEWVRFDVREDTYREAQAADESLEPEQRDLLARTPIGVFDASLALTLERPVPASLLEPRFDVLMLIVSNEMHLQEFETNLTENPACPLNSSLRRA